jgi:hypothetical protein
MLGWGPFGESFDARSAQRRAAAFNRCQADLRALVEPAIGHLATAWALRRWRGLL